MSIEEEIAKAAGVPAEKKEKPKPRSKELETLFLKDGLRFTLKSVEYFDEVAGGYREPRLDYQVQFKRTNPTTKLDEYVRVPYGRSIEDFEMIINHSQNMIKIMKGAEVNFERTTTLTSDTDTAVDFIKTTYKTGSTPKKK
jgi:hypothetical protein